MRGSPTITSIPYDAAAFCCAVAKPHSAAVELRAMGGGRVVKRIFAITQKSITQFVEQHSDCDCYFGVAARHANAKDGSLQSSPHLAALFTDIDFKATAPDLAQVMLESFPFPASAIVESGGGLHAYWFLASPIPLPAEAERAKKALRKLAHFLGGDLAAAEPARILRVPGTLNHKYKPPRPVQVAGFDPSRVYELSDFESLLEDVEDQDFSGIENQNAAGGGPLRMPDEPLHEGEGRNNLLYRVVRSLKARNLTEGAIRAAVEEENRRKCDPPLCASELDVLITHALAQADRPSFTAQQSTKNSVRPAIDLIPGALPEIVDRAEGVLLENSERLKVFQRSGEIVRAISLDQETLTRRNRRDGLQRPEGSVILLPITQPALQEILDRLIIFQTTDAKGERKPKDCPAKIPTNYLSRVGFWKLPQLVGVIEAPILRPDGTVLTTPGYDGQTGLYLNCSSDWPAVPEHPTHADAKAALRVLMEPFDEFPFVADEDRSVYAAEILTAIQRRMLETAPLFVHSAPGQRTGKTRLSESTGILATGRIPAAAGVSREGEELRKTITSILREGHLIASLDNITHPLDSPDLARALTGQTYADRLLGSNVTLRLPTNVPWIATGNNLKLKGDMPSRALECRIDAQMERPEERTFRIPDLRAHLLEHRHELVIASLTILRAYHVAGRPIQDIKPWGGFDDWSRAIRAPLVWLGCADPCKTREQIVSSDPDREHALEVFDCWHEAFADRPMLVREVIHAVREDHEKLGQALLMIAAKRDDSHEIDPRRLGNWLAGIQDRVFNDRRLTRDRKISRAQAWRLNLVGEGSPNRSSVMSEVEVGIE
jgi:RepB DNA-primase from phage plasmid